MPNICIGPWVQNNRRCWDGPNGTVGAIDLRIGNRNIGIFSLNADVPVGYTHLGSNVKSPLNSIQKLTFNNLVGVSFSSSTLADILFELFTQKCDYKGNSQVKPLIPNRERLNEIYLPGFGVVDSRNFGINDVVYWNHLKNFYKEQYREAKTNQGNGKLSKDFHRKLLTVWGEKYLISKPEDLFVPNDLPKERPLPHSTTLTDNFNGGKQLTWSEEEGTFFATGNVYKANSGGGGEWCITRHSSPLSTDDHYAQFKMANTPPSPEYNMHVSVRHSAGGSNLAGAPTKFNAYSLAFLSDVGNKWVLTKMLNGNFPTNLLTNNTETVYTTNDIIKCEIDGSTLRGWKNGNLIGSVTDTAITNIFNTGFITYMEVAGDEVWIDDFEASDVGGGGGSSSVRSLVKCIDSKRNWLIKQR